MSIVALTKCSTLLCLFSGALLLHSDLSQAVSVGKVKTVIQKGAARSSDDAASNRPRSEFIPRAVMQQHFIDFEKGGGILDLKEMYRGDALREAVSVNKVLSSQGGTFSTHGLSETIDDLTMLVSGSSNEVIVLTGPKGAGKTTVLTGMVEKSLGRNGTEVQGQLDGADFLTVDLAELRGESADDVLKAALKSTRRDLKGKGPIVVHIPNAEKLLPVEKDNENPGLEILRLIRKSLGPGDSQSGQGLRPVRFVIEADSVELDKLSKVNIAPSRNPIAKLPVEGLSETDMRGLVDRLAHYFHQRSGLVVTDTQKREIISLLEKNKVDGQRADLAVRFFDELASFKENLMSRNSDIVESVHSEMKAKIQANLDRVSEYSGSVVEAEKKRLGLELKKIEAKLAPFRKRKAELERVQAQLAEAKKREPRNEQVVTALETILNNPSEIEIQWIVARTTGRPLSKIQGDFNGLTKKEMRETLEDELIGQPQAVDIAMEMLEKMEKRESIPGNRMASTLLMIGPPGLGKTTLAKAIAKLTPSKRLAEVDGGQIVHDHDVSRAQGSAPGLIKSDQDTEFTAAARPMETEGGGALLYDEIEKADPTFQNTLLKVAQDGVMANPNGNISTRSSVMIAAANDLQYPGEIPPEVFDMSISEMTEFLKKLTKDSINPKTGQPLWLPALLNRMSYVLALKPPNLDDLAHVLRHQFKKSSDLMRKEQGIPIDIEMTPEASMKKLIDDFGKDVSEVSPRLVVNKDYPMDIINKLTDGKPVKSFRIGDDVVPVVNQAGEEDVLTIGQKLLIRVDSSGRFFGEIH